MIQWLEGGTMKEIKSIISSVEDMLDKFNHSEVREFVKEHIDILNELIDKPMKSGEEISDELIYIIITESDYEVIEYITEELQKRHDLLTPVKKRRKLRRKLKKSGYTGISFRNNKWEARIKLKTKDIHLCRNISKEYCVNFRNNYILEHDLDVKRIQTWLG